MIMSVKLPDRFVPEENEYRCYCAIKLLKGGYINKEEALNICGFPKADDKTKKAFDVLYKTFEKKYVKMCGYGYADEDFLDDMKLKKPNNANLYHF